MYVSLRIGSPVVLGYDPAAPEGPGRAPLWLYGEDCDTAVERLGAAGAEIMGEPVDEPGAERVARVLDPDGMTLILGQRPA